MRESEPVRLVTPEERVEADPTPGMTRERAIDVEGLWAGFVRTEPGMTSGWHHHGEYQTYIYVLSGAARLDTFEDGAIVRHEVGPGSFIVVPRATAHREGSASPTGVEAVLVRIGSGQLVFPVEGLPETD